MHILLRCALALTTSNVDVERLFWLLNHINRVDRRRLNMESLEQLLVVIRDAQHWSEYEFKSIVAAYQLDRRNRARSGPRSDRGIKRKNPSGFSSDSSSTSATSDSSTSDSSTSESSSSDSSGSSCSD